MTTLKMAELATELGYFAFKVINISSGIPLTPIYDSWDLKHSSFSDKKVKKFKVEEVFIRNGQGEKVPFGDCFYMYI